MKIGIRVVGRAVKVVRRPRRSTVISIRERACYSDRSGRVSQDHIRLRPGNRIGLNILALLGVHLRFEGGKFLCRYCKVGALCRGNRKTQMNHIGVRDGVSELEILRYNNGLLITIIY